MRVRQVRTVGARRRLGVRWPVGELAAGEPAGSLTYSATKLAVVGVEIVLGAELQAASANTVTWIS